MCRENSRDMLTTPSKPACYSDLISFKTANSAAVTLIGENPQPLSQAHYIMPVFASLSPSLLSLSVSSIDLCTFFLYEMWKIIISSQEYACIHSCSHSLSHTFIDLCFYSNTFHICWKFAFTKEAFPNHLENEWCTKNTAFSQVGHSDCCTVLCMGCLILTGHCAISMTAAI